MRPQNLLAAISIGRIDFRMNFRFTSSPLSSKISIYRVKKASSSDRIHPSRRLQEGVGGSYIEKPIIGHGFQLAYGGPQELQKLLLEEYETNAKMVDLLNLRGKLQFTILIT